MSNKKSQGASSNTSKVVFNRSGLNNQMDKYSILAEEQMVKKKSNTPKRIREIEELKKILNQRNKNSIYTEVLMLLTSDFMRINNRLELFSSYKKK